MASLVVNCAVLAARAAAASPVERFVADEVLVAGLTLQSPAAVYMPAGRFELGSNAAEVRAAQALCLRWAPAARCRRAELSAEAPRRWVELSAFWIQRTEVSRRHYQRCVDAGRCDPLPPPIRGAAPEPDESWPATWVRHRDARRYCAFVGGRLPTEDEFERAARGKSRRRFPWGNQWHSRAANGASPSAKGAAARALQPVGSYPGGRTPRGVLDLAGNAAEWTADRYHARSSGPRAAGASFHSVRGGGFLSGPEMLRGAARRAMDPSLRAPDVGFRCVHDEPPR